MCGGAVQRHLQPGVGSYITVMRMISRIKGWNIAVSEDQVDSTTKLACPLFFISCVQAGGEAGTPGLDE